MREQWDELKETIIELRDNHGTGTQREVCQFLANLMDVLKAQMEPNADVVEVVRCKDCIYSQDKRACNLPYGENGYCPLGERRE